VSLNSVLLDTYMVLFNLSLTMSNLSSFPGMNETIVNVAPGLKCIISKYNDSEHYKNDRRKNMFIDK